MRVVCEHCGRQLNLPDDKVPDRPFTMTCPGCKGKLHIDPKAVAGENSGDETRNAYPEPVPAAHAAAGEQVWSPNGGARQRSPHDTGSLTRLTALAPADQQLLDRASPLALVASLGLPPAPELTELLQSVGMEEVRHFSDLAEACEEAAEADVGVLLIRVEKATPPPFDALTPVYKLPAEIRRRVFVALLAENVRSLDGQAAFYLQINCVLSSQEMESFPTKLRRALLYHLRLYRYWAAEE
jgi:hypothetical protein